MKSKILKSALISLKDFIVQTILTFAILTIVFNFYGLGNIIELLRKIDIIEQSNVITEEYAITAITLGSQLTLFAIFIICLTCKIVKDLLQDNISISLGCIFGFIIFLFKYDMKLYIAQGIFVIYFITILYQKYKNKESEESYVLLQNQQK